MSKMNGKSLIRPTLVLTVICLAVTALLSVTNYFTADRIAAAKAAEVSAAMEQLVPGAQFTDLKPDGQSEVAYEAVAGGETAGYVFLTKELGYKSKIQVMTAVDYNGTVTGVQVIDCAEESPGIGQKVGTTPSFTDQFTGQSNQAQADAITGATFSSKAVTKAVNDALELYAQITANTTKGGGSVE